MCALDDPQTTSSSDGSSWRMRLRRLRGELAVVVGGAVAELPRAVHLVAEAPHPDAERLGAAVGDALVGQRGAGADVGVLEQVERLQRAAGAEVDGEHQLAADLVEPRRRTRAGRPRWSRWSARPGRGGAGAPRAGRRCPPSGSRRRSCRRGSGWSRPRARCTSSMTSCAEALGVGRRVAGLVDAVVDAAAEVLDERAEQSAVDGADREVRVDGEACGEHGLLSMVSAGWSRGVRYLRLPSERPPCQYFCRERNAMTSGMIETSEPMMIRLQSECAAAVVGRGQALPQAEPDGDREQLGVRQHRQRQEVVVPGADDRQQQHGDDRRAASAAARPAGRCGTRPRRRPARRRAARRARHPRCRPASGRRRTG